MSLLSTGGGRRRRRGRRRAADAAHGHLVYATAERVVGIVKLPLDGNPHKAMGLIAHPARCARPPPSTLLTSFAYRSASFSSLRPYMYIRFRVRRPSAAPT